MKKSIHINNEKLVYLINKPKKSLGTIILIPGMMGSQKDSLYAEIAAGLYKKKFTVIQPDFRNNLGESSGTIETVSIATHLEDLEHIIAAEKLKEYVLLGHSFGGFVCMRFACTHSPSAIITLGAVFNFDRYLERKYSFIARLFSRVSGIEQMVNKNSGETFRLRTGFQKQMQVGKKFLVAHAKKISCPVLLFHGKKDSTVELADAETYYKLLKSTHAEKYIVDDNHFFSKHREKILEKIDNFLKHL